jgi:hypothetical protein
MNCDGGTGPNSALFQRRSASAPARGLGHRRCVEMCAPAPFGLGTEHGGVGVAHEGLAVGAVLREHADADAAREVHFVPGHVEGSGQQSDHLVRHAHGLAAIDHVFEQAHEFIATEPRQAVAQPEVVGESLRDGLQQPVADIVSGAVVDLLEAVEVDEQQDQPALAARGLGNGAVELVTEGQTIGQAGQRVVVREVLEALLGRLSDFDFFEQFGSPLADALVELMVGRFHSRFLGAETLDEIDVLVAETNQRLARGVLDARHAGDDDEEHGHQRGEAGVLDPALHQQAEGRDTDGRHDVTMMEPAASPTRLV